VKNLLPTFDASSFLNFVFWYQKLIKLDNQKA